MRNATREVFSGAVSSSPPIICIQSFNARRLAWYTHSPAQHGVHSARRNERVLLHTPKRLVLFRNGEPEVKHTLTLQRRTTYSFEALLDHMSEVMHFPVLKLHTPEGRRVDGLPALILCSGVLVAAGREPFKKSNYDVQNSSPPKWPPAKRLGRRRPITRKKKSRSAKSCPFSLSSESYIVNQIQSSLPGSMCDFPSNPNGSAGAATGYHLESVSETEIITSLDGEREDDPHMPSDDDIEKSFRVNQDGSMTVEMKVRLTIKEEETIHWTTTVSRSNVCNQFTAATLPCPELEANLADSLPPQNDPGAIEVNESDPNNTSCSCPEENCKVHPQSEINGGSMELERLAHKQGSVESISDTETNKNSLCSNVEDPDNGEAKQNHPVPKPRCTLPSDTNTTTSIQSSDYRSSEVLQLQDYQKKTVLHICEENFSGNSQHGYIASSDTVSSDKTIHYFNEDVKSETMASVKCQSIWEKDKPYAATYKTNTSSTQRAKVSVTPSPKASASRGVITVDTTTKRKSVRVIVKKNHLFRSAYPERKPRDKKDDILKEIKKIRADILSQKGAIKHVRAKAVQKLLKRRNNSGNGLKPQTERVQTTSSTDDPSPQLVEKEQNNLQVQADGFTRPKENLHKTSVSKGTMTQQTSDYVELWLQSQQIPAQSCLEAIPKNNTMAKASLFNDQSCKTIQPSTKDKIDEKGIHVHSPNAKRPTLSDLTKTNGNQQISELIVKTSSHDTENTLRRPINIQSKPLTELIDLQAQKYYTVKMAVRPDMKPVLDRLCNSILSLREITQHKRSLCLKTSKCLPDFSSSLASTFSSSSRVVLAFLSIMTLKDGLSHLNTCSQTEANLSSSEAMLMLQSLQELAVIEDGQHLRISLSDLYNSASDQLLQNWKGFQVLNNKARTSGGSESHHRSSIEEEEHSIQVLMEHLGVPERVREELAALNHADVEYMTCSQMEDTDTVRDSLPEMNMNGVSEHRSKERVFSFSEFVLEDYVSTYVNSVIDKAINAHLTAGSQARPDVDNLVITDRHQRDLRNEIFSNIKRTFQGDAIPDSAICEDVSSSESGFEAEMCREMGLKRTGLQGMEKVRRKRPGEEETVKKHQEKEERQWEIDEGRGTWEESSSEVEKTVLQKEEVIGTAVNDIEKYIDTVEEEGTQLSEESLITCTGKLHFSVKEKSRQQKDNESEIFPCNEEENLTVKSPEQVYSNEKISGLWSNERDVALPEVQGISHCVHIESNTEVDQDLCMESGTYSEEEQVILEAPECYTIYQEDFEEMSNEATECEDNEIHFKEEIASTVVKLICSLQDQEKSECKRPHNTAQTFGEQLLNHINEPNLEAAEFTRTTDRASMDSVSSSLAFSYDSKNSALAKDSEVHIQTNKVKSIRDMFLAKKNSTDIQPRSPSCDSAEYRFESSDKKQHQSTDDSREEEDPCKLSIAKGYVKRTIERLYGQGPKGLLSSDEKRSSSAHKVKKREGLKGTNSPRLPSINEAHTNAIQDLSYFNATSTRDGFNEPTQCVTLNARVGPNDAVLIDKGRWLCRESQTSPKPCPENEDTPKRVKSETDSGNEDIPYSLFGHSPIIPDKDSSLKEQGENTGCLGRTFTYFHLPNANDSEIQPEEQKPDPPEGKTEIKDTEHHSIVSALVPPSNKVHPITETTPPVVTQPTKGQSATVTRRSAEPDALEIIYVFCGQHCPIL
ncbi:oxygen-regulated protein 1-like [Pimephales promelas]|uniref:oxygen-regulated protein 1-like n=1 Tax=Pimephales promelas TaxID=90988 RepID=UPI001955CD1C|nr:oxygen-regulated protein 1-like [Pimephales promelas]